MCCFCCGRILRAKNSWITIFVYFIFENSVLHIFLQNYHGRFPFSQKFRKFRFGAKWKTFFRFARLENSQKKWNCSKGSPVFPVGTSQLKFVFHLQNFSSLYQFHAFRGLFKWPGFPRPRFQKWPLIRVRFLEAFCKQTSGLLRVLCLLRSSARAWKFIAVRMCLI